MKNRMCIILLRELPYSPYNVDGMYILVASSPRPLFSEASIFNYKIAEFAKQCYASFLQRDQTQKP